MEDILKFRKILGMSQTEFSNYIGVPIGTLRNWEQGIRKPPEYVFTMILKILERDSMVNIETIKFQNMLNILAEKTSYGYKEWNDVESIDLDDYDAELFSGIMYDRNNNNKVIMDTCLYGHHDIIKYLEKCR